MTNNRGQALIIFVLFLPLFLLFLVYVFDISNILYEENRLKSIGNEALDYLVNGDVVYDEDIKELIKKNDSSVAVNVYNEENKKIELIKTIPSNFGHIIGKEKYLIKVVVEKE